MASSSQFKDFCPCHNLNRGLPPRLSAGPSWECPKHSGTKWAGGVLRAKYLIQRLPELLTLLFPFRTAVSAWLDWRWVACTKHLSLAWSIAGFSTTPWEWMLLCSQGKVLAKQLLLLCPRSQVVVSSSFIFSKPWEILKNIVTPVIRQGALSKLGHNGQRACILLNKEERYPSSKGSVYLLQQTLELG